MRQIALGAISCVPPGLLLKPNSSLQELLPCRTLDLPGHLDFVKTLQWEELLSRPLWTTSLRLDLPGCVWTL